MNSLRSRLSLAGAVAVAIAAGLAFRATDDRVAHAAPLFADTTPAKNPAGLVVQCDSTKIVGWIAGTTPHAGQSAAITINGKTYRPRIADDNTFAFDWPPNDAGRAVSVKFGEWTEVLTLPTRVESEPCVFFVIDRTVYRPTQAMHFAGFLRKLDHHGEFQPLPNASVDVELVSQRKQTKAATFKLVSDDHGRITASYVFTESDPLDDYDLNVKGYRGSAKLMLGEYRKSKVKLKVNGEVDGDKLALKFQAVDFLEQPVAATKVHFSAQVTRRDRAEKTHARKETDFAYYAGSPFDWADTDDLADDEALLAAAEGAFQPRARSTATGLLAQVQHEIAMTGTAPGTFDLALQKEWRTAEHAVTVAAVVIDANGREQRTTHTFPLTGKADPKRLTLDIAKTTHATGEPINVKAAFANVPADTQLTLVAMKLSAAVVTPTPPMFEEEMEFRRSRRTPNGPGFGRWTPATGTEFQRSLVTAVPFKGDRATLRLDEPGAYKFVATAQLPDGKTLRAEVGCVVQTPEQMKPLVLQLDRTEWKAGDTLTGSVQSRFAGARVLVTVRDATGIRLWKPIELEGGEAALSLPLPADLRYGCTVDAQYADSRDDVEYVSKFVRVDPADRVLEIKTSMRDEVSPGEPVRIDIDVNRREQVDLVVSVYDQSLLGIAPDRAVDIRDFYLADTRIRNAMADDFVRRRLGTATIGDLMRKAQQLLKDEPDLDKTPRGRVLRSMVTQYENGVNQNLYLPQLSALLQVGGVPVSLDHWWINYYGNHWYVEYRKDTDRKVVDALGGKVNQWYPFYQVIDGRLWMSETHTSYTPATWQAMRERRMYGYYGYNQYSHLGYNNSLMFQNFNMPQNARGMARGDSHFSVSGNSVHSVEGQAFMSHLPPSGATAPELLTADAGQEHIGIRRDFSDSAFWNANVRTDASGKASVEFKLPDSLTNWQVVVTAVSPRMHVGTHKAAFRTNKPVMIWPMLPRVFTEGDVVELFGSVHNRTDAMQQMRVKLKVENGEILSPAERTIAVPAKSNASVYWTFRANRSGFTQLLMSADCDAGSDASLKRLPVSRAAAEEAVTASGVVKKRVAFDIPADVDLRHAKLEVSVAPSLAADMAQTLNYLVEYPYGCVEQTMSRFLPAIKVAGILKRYDIEDAKLKEKLPGCVAGGIKRLLELQQPDGGWGWNGNSQTHEMMTPYALFGLLEAEKAGYTIPNETAIQRGLDRLQLFLNTMNENQTADRIYCMYVFGNRRALQDDWWVFIEQRLKANALTDYTLAMALEMATNNGKKELAGKLADKLRDRAEKVGGRVFWKTAGFSRWGDDPFEVTAAVLKAFAAHDVNEPLIDGILGYFAATKRGDRWNSTKDTAMILFAMCDYLAKANHAPDALQVFQIGVNGQAKVGVKFEGGLTQKVSLPLEHLKPGANVLEFDTAMTGVMYRLVFTHWKNGTDIPPRADGIEVTRTLFLLDGKGGRAELKSGDSVPRGSYLLSVVTAKHSLNTPMRYVLIEDPKLCSGEFVPIDDARFVNHLQSTQYVLREERTAHVAFHHEQTPAIVSDYTVVLAEMAGKYLIPPAKCELMYQTDFRGHSGTFTLNVVEAKK